MHRTADGVEVLFALSTEEEGSRIVICGELDFATATCLGGLPFKTRPRDREVTVDLMGLTFLDSAGLAALVEMCRSMRSSGTKVSVLIPDLPAVTRVIDLHDHLRDELPLRAPRTEPQKEETHAATG